MKLSTSIFVCIMIAFATCNPTPPVTTTEDLPAATTNTTEEEEYTTLSGGNNRIMTGFGSIGYGLPNDIQGQQYPWSGPGREWPWYSSGLNQGCKYWCPANQYGQNVQNPYGQNFRCCDGMTNKLGCPAVRPYCRNFRYNYSPQHCSHDSECAAVGMLCCFDVCVGSTVCKPREY